MQAKINNIYNLVEDWTWQELDDLIRELEMLSDSKHDEEMAEVFDQDDFTTSDPYIQN